jgi:hypothetical protein
VVPKQKPKIQTQNPRNPRMPASLIGRREQRQYERILKRQE